MIHNIPFLLDVERIKLTAIIVGQSIIKREHLIKDFYLWTRIKFNHSKHAMLIRFGWQVRSTRSKILHNGASWLANQQTKTLVFLNNFPDDEKMYH